VDGQATVDSAESLSSFFLTLDATDEVAAASLLQATNDEHLAGSEHSMGTGIAAIAAEAAAEVLTKAIPQKLAVQSYLQPHVITSDKTVLNPVIGGASSVLLRRFVLKLIITKTGSGQTSGKSRNKRTFSAGIARKGGTITSTGGQQQLDVRYHCQRPGAKHR
jgi:hypothetical protein